MLKCKNLLALILMTLACVLPAAANRITAESPSAGDGLS